MGANQSTPGQAVLTEPSILNKDAQKKFENFKTAIEMLSQNDPNLIKEQIEKYNQTAPGNLKLNLSQNVIAQIDRFHQNVVKEFNYNLPDKTNEFKTKMSVPKTLVDNTLPSSIKAELDFNNTSQELKEKAAALAPFLKANSKLNSDVDTIINTVVGLKSKYSYFEYKYIQLNIFMLALFTNYNDIIKSLIDSIVQIVTTHEDQMSEKLDSLLPLVLKLLNTNQISTDDLDQIAGVVNQMKTQLATDTSATIAKLNDGSEKIKKTLEAIQGMSENPNPTSGGAQQGGFVRGSSSFPQSFFELPQ